MAFEIIKLTYLLTYLMANMLQKIKFTRQNIKHWSLIGAANCTVAYPTKCFVGRITRLSYHTELFVAVSGISR